MNYQLAQQMLPWAFGWGGFSSAPDRDYFGGPGKTKKRGYQPPGGFGNEGNPVQNAGDLGVRPLPGNMRSTALPFLQQAGYQQMINPITRAARHGRLQFTDQGFTFPSGNTYDYANRTGLAFKMDPKQITPELLMQRGIALRAALEELQNRWIAKRSARRS